MNNAKIAAIKEKFASAVKAIMRELETACRGIINKDLVIYLSED